MSKSMGNTATQYRVLRTSVATRIIERNNEYIFVTVDCGAKCVIPNISVIEADKSFIEWLTDWVDIK